MKIMKAIWGQMVRFGRWMNANATKRWLLALDRICTTFLITMIYDGVRGELTKGDQLIVYDLVLVGVILLFLVLYTPSYMYPSSHEPVGIAVDEKKKP